MRKHPPDYSGAHEIRMEVRCTQCGMRYTVRVQRNDGMRPPWQALWNCPHCKYKNMSPSNQP